MRILHLSKYYHPYRGGIEKAIKELSECAVQQGHEVTVLCASESNRRSEEVINGVKVIRLPKWLTLFSQPITPSIFWEISACFKQADVIHLHTPNPLFELACLSIPIQVPLIVTYHCEVMKARALNNLYRPVSKAILEKASRILVATQQHIDHSQALKPFAGKCEVIPFGIHPKYRERTTQMSLHMKNINDIYGRYFLFVGRMVPYKGIPVLLEAMKTVPQNLVLIGKGPWLEPWRAMSESMGLEKRVHFLGGIDSDDEFGAYLQGCDSLVLPSINEAEAFGLVLLEAMSCGKPMITTELNSGVQFVNQAGMTGLSVPPMNAKALARAMQTISSDDVLRARLGQQAAARFNKHFLISDCFQRHYSLYQNMAAKKSA